MTGDTHTHKKKKSMLKCGSGSPINQEQKTSNLAKSCSFRESQGSGNVLLIISMWHYTFHVAADEWKKNAIAFEEDDICHVSKKLGWLANRTTLKKKVWALNSYLLNTNSSKILVTKLNSTTICKGPQSHLLRMLLHKVRRSFSQLKKLSERTNHRFELDFKTILNDRECAMCLNQWPVD